MRATLSSALLACLMSALVTPTAAGRQLEADLVVVNANVRTMDPKRPAAEAVAVHANRITAVGTSAEVRRLAGPRTRVVDARGALLLPGFNDAHVQRARCSPSAPTGRSRRSTPSWASTPRPPAARSTAGTRRAGCPGRRLRSRRPSAPTPPARPTQSSRKGRREL